MTLLFWVMVLLLWAAQDIASGKPIPEAQKLLLGATCALGLVFCASLAGFILWAWRLRKPIMATLVVLATSATALLHGLIDAFLMQILGPGMGLRPMPLAELFNRGLMPFVLIYGFYALALGLMLSEKAVRNSERRLAEARSAAHSAQLAALRFQLNPHFLFNTLNTISSLIVTNAADDADRMTMKLSDFLRLTFEADPDAEVTLDEEWAITRAYLDIEAVRFAERLNVVFECPAELLDVYVPSFLLQPIVENAIKHAVQPSRRLVTLSVRGSKVGELLRLLIEDDGGGIVQTVREDSRDTGDGLHNVKRRLTAFYGEAGDLKVGTSECGFVVILTLPIRVATIGEAA